MPAIIGTTRQTRAASSAWARASAASVDSSARSSPREFSRAGAYNARGSAIAGCGAPTVPSRSAIARTVRTGSSTSSSSARFGSATRLTNEVFAPFSSSRRTRYASRVSCVPTGA